MKTPHIEDVLHNLRSARRRWCTQIFLTALVKSALIAGALLVGVAAVNRWALGRLPWDAEFGVAVAALTLAAALLVTYVKRPSLTQMAALLDHLGGTRDRFLTTLHFSEETEVTDNPMRSMAVRECVRFIGGGRFSRLIPIRTPRSLVYLLVPLVTIALLQWEAKEARAERAEDAAAARASVEDTAKRLEELARQTEKASEQSENEELKKLAEQIQRSAEQLRANATRSDEAEKAALREISALEQLVQEMQKSPSVVTPEEMQALAQALEQTEATQQAAAAMKEGDLAKAAEKLEQAMRELAEQQDERTAEQLKQALEDAVKRLAEQKKISEALQKLAQQMRQATASQGGNSSEAAKQLAQMLRQMAQGKSSQGQSGQPSEQALQNLLSALQNMKFGEGQTQPGGSPQPEQSPGLTMMESFSKDPGNTPGVGNPQVPSGQPGSEFDTGTTDSPFGKARNKPGEGAPAEQIAGRQGKGESLQQSLTAAGDLSKSNRGYRQLYEAMAPAAEAAVLQENIPLGSRFFIKRYFESIRPQE